jgi:hypothetical protein
MTDMSARRIDRRFEDWQVRFQEIVFYLRVQADCISQLIPYFYGPEDRADIAHHSFHRQREWLQIRQPNFDRA